MKGDASVNMPEPFLKGTLKIILIIYRGIKLEGLRERSFKFL